MKKKRKGRILSRKDLQKIIGDDLQKLARDLTDNMAYVFPPDPVPPPPHFEAGTRRRRSAK